MWYAFLVPSKRTKRQRCSHSPVSPKNPWSPILCSVSELISHTVPHTARKRNAQLSSYILETTIRAHTSDKTTKSHQNIARSHAIVFIEFSPLNSSDSIPLASRTLSQRTLHPPSLTKAKLYSSENDTSQPTTTS